MHCGSEEHCLGAEHERLMSCMLTGIEGILIVIFSAIVLHLKLPGWCALQATSQSAPKELHGFSLVQQEFVQEYNSDVLIYRHEKTGRVYC